MTPRSHTAKRRRFVLPLVLLLVGGGGVSAGYLLGRPPAVTAPPPPPPATAVVEQRRLVDEVTLSCRTRAATQNIVYTPSGGGPAIVTHAPNVRSLRSGVLIAEVSGRPVIALRGPFALYRDLVAGDRGRDVRMLQDALNDIDITTPRDGVYGPATARSIRALYSRLGYTAPTAPVAATASLSPVPSPTASAPRPAQADPGLPPALRSELVFLPQLPLAWAGHAPAVGARVTDTLGTLRIPTGTMTCSSDRAADIPPGAAVTLGRARGKVTGVDGGGRTPNAAPSVTVQVIDGTPEGSGEVNGSVVISRSDPRALVVPLTALGGGAEPRVIVHDTGQKEVPVTVSAVIGGYAAVAPSTPGALKPGDHVLVTSS